MNASRETPRFAEVSDANLETMHGHMAQSARRAAQALAVAQEVYDAVTADLAVIADEQLRRKEARRLHAKEIHERTGMTSREIAKEVATRHRGALDKLAEHDGAPQMRPELREAFDAEMAQPGTLAALDYLRDH